MDSDKLIIECPDCSTKFNLKADALKGVSEPKFHCSKCDNIFEVKNIDENDHNSLDPNNEDDYNNRDEPSENTYRSKKTEDLFIAKDKLKDDLFKEDFKEPKLREEKTFKKNKESSLLDSNFIDSFPEEAIDEESLIGAKSGSEDEDVKDLEKDMHHYQSEQLELDDYYKKRAEEMQEGLTSSPVNSNIITEKLNIKTTVKIFSPLVVLLLILGIFSFFLGSNPEYSSNLMSGIIGTSPKVAPAKVSLNNIKIKTLVLDSGEKAVLVSGVLANLSNKNFNEVIIEAIAFDNDGMKIKSEKAHLNSSLVRTRISALNPRMIQTLQKRKPIKKLNFKPGEKANFVVALLDNVNDTEYFDKLQSYSARIYSVM